MTDTDTDPHAAVAAWLAVHRDVRKSIVEAWEACNQLGSAGDEEKSVMLMPNAAVRAFMFGVDEMCEKHDDIRRGIREMLEMWR